MSLVRTFLSSLFLGLVLIAAAVSAQDAAEGTVVGAPDRSQTGGAQTLEDILARQRGEAVDDDFRRLNTGDDTGAPASGPLGTRGGASDPELWRALRYGTADVNASNDSPGAAVLVQDGGMPWLRFRAGPLRTWGGYALLGMLGLLALFYLLRGKVMIDAGRAGITIERFKPIERFGHWLLAGSFVLLGITGLISLFGRVGLIPWMGHETYSSIAVISKWIHNNVSWAFMLGLVMVLVMWIAHNIPNRHDIKWLLMGGGLFGKGHHPPAKKFNAGQKIVFWSVILLGASISVSGLSLLFPFQLPMFAKTFALLNDIGAPGWFGADALPVSLAPHAEMQLSQLWHSIVAFALMVVILGHIYIGTLGMEGAFDAMHDGQVDVNWAKEHHNLWVAELEAEKGAPFKSPPPAE